MKRNGILIGIFLALNLCVLFAFSVFFKEKWNGSILTTKDSYAEKYAKENGIKVEIISDTEKQDYEEKIEEFSYNKVENGIEFTKYLGVSNEIIIPSVYDGYLVKSVNESLFKESSIKKVFIPDTILEIPKEALKEVEIVCNHTDTCKNWQSDTNLKVTVLDDSEKIIPSSKTVDFEYNLKEDKIELTKYIGKENKMMIIPSTINGYEVSEITFHESFSKIYIPSTVTKIDLKISALDMNSSFIPVILLNLFCSILIIVFINRLYKTKSPLIWNTPVLIFSVLYFVGQILLDVHFFQIQEKTNEFVLYSILIGILYLILSVAILLYRKRILTGESENGDNLFQISKILDEIEDLLFETKEENLKKELEKLKEDVKYSDPVSIESSLEMEKKLEEKIVSLNEDINPEKIKEIRHLLVKRNDFIKKNKK